MKVKILEGIIISIVLLLAAYAVCGCEEEPLYVFFDNNDFPVILDRDNVTYIGVSEEVFWHIIEQEAQRNWEVSESN